MHFGFSSLFCFIEKTLKWLFVNYLWGPIVVVPRWIFPQRKFFLLVGWWMMDLVQFWHPKTFKTHKSSFQTIRSLVLGLWKIALLSPGFYTIRYRLKKPLKEAVRVIITFILFEEKSIDLINEHVIPTPIFLNVVKMAAI